MTLTRDNSEHVFLPGGGGDFGGGYRGRGE